MAYVWQMKEAGFVVGHADAPQSLEDAARATELFNLLREQVKKLASKNTGQVGPEKEIRLDTHPGLEQRLDLFNGTLVQRTYIVGSRLYQAVFVLKTTQQVYESAAAGVLDTLKLLNVRDVTTRESEKAAAAEPSPLPQAPATQRLGTDATDEGLRGPVRNVLEESEDLSGTWSRQGRKRNSFDSYNDQGNLTRREFYDYRGNLREITVYGYIDDNRVSSSKTIEHEYNPPPISVGIAGGAKKSDPRYHYKFEFKYDDKKRLTEKTWFHSNGDVWLRYVYKYLGNQREELVYTSEGVLNQRYVEVLDDKGNEIEHTIFEKNGTVRLRQTYKYEFDAKGNWTKRTTHRFVTREGREVLEPDNVYYRTITYYK